MRGTVKWFNSQKGYGFLQPEGGGADIFVHYSAIEGEGYKRLEENEEVEFETAPGPKGLQATNVRILPRDQQTFSPKYAVDRT